MSRIVVKNLPQKISEDRLRAIFGEKGGQRRVTDVQLKYTKDGKARNFAFIGFKTEKEAEEARAYFHKTYIEKSKVNVEMFSDFSATDRPKVWSKYSQEKEKETTDKLRAEKEEAEKSRIKEKRELRLKAKEDPFAELKNDPKFDEFLKVQRNIGAIPGKHVWSNDDLLLPHEQDTDEAEKTKSEHGPESGPRADDELETQGKDVQESHEPDHVGEKKPRLPFTIKLKGLPYKCKKRQVRDFLKPLKLISLRVPVKVKGIAYASFEDEKELNKALIKHRSFLEGHRIDVVKFNVQPEDAPLNKTEPKNSKKYSKNVLEPTESVAETGRIYVRNLSYTCSADDLEHLFNKYGPLSEVHLPLDSYTSKIKGFAFITFMFPEHAVKAFAELDRNTFQGRLLHLIPAHSKPENVELNFVDDKSSFKKQKETEKKKEAGKSQNWNALFLGPNAVAEVMAEKFNIKKSELLADKGSKDSVAVRMALGETQLVNETKRFLTDNGIELDAFNHEDAVRSKTVLLVKHLPAKTSDEEIRKLFAEHGVVKQVLLPPFGITAVVEMSHPTEAMQAFRKLAYSNFKHIPLYLEWAPVNIFKGHISIEETLDSACVPAKEGVEKEITQNVEDEHGVQQEPEEGASLFIKNVNFDTTDSELANHFAKFGEIVRATVARRKHPSGDLLSMGYGFVDFFHKKAALAALKELQNSILDGHSLQIKQAHSSSLRGTHPKYANIDDSRKVCTKIIVRNIPFEAKQIEVEELFSAFGGVKSIRLPKKLIGTGTHRGFGFVEFVTKHDAKRALEALSQSTHLYGRRLVLEWAEGSNKEDTRGSLGDDNEAFKAGKKSAQKLGKGSESTSTGFPDAEDPSHSPRKKQRREKE